MKVEFQNYKNVLSCNHSKENTVLFFKISYHRNATFAAIQCVFELNLNVIDTCLRLEKNVYSYSPFHLIKHPSIHQATGET